MALSYLVVIVLSLIINYYVGKQNIEDIIEYELSIIGAMHQDKPVDSLSIISGNIDSMDYEIGKKLLNEYSYGLETSVRFTQHSSILIRNMIATVGLISLFYLTTVLIVFKSFGKLFKEISDISSKIRFEEFESITSIKSLSESEISLLSNAINSLIIRLKHQLEILNIDKHFLQKMLADISHQMKTPLSSIRMYNEILIDKPDIEDTLKIEFLNQSKSQIDRLDWLILGLLKSAKIEANAIEMVKIESDLSSTIEIALAPFSNLAYDKNIHIEVGEVNNIMIVHDFKWVAEALGNIIKNAIEHTQEGGFIKIYIEETPMTVEVHIEDNGEGIKRQYLSQVFERFYQVKGEKSSSAGIGLGLSKEILEKNDATIYVNSVYGKGSDFIITFLKKT